MAIHFKKGYKYQLVVAWEWKLVEPITIRSDYSNRYYWISRDGRVGAHIGCAWDGPTWCPDLDMLMEASLCHDILHWLIAKGVIPEVDNHTIDREFEHVIRTRGPIPKVFGLQLKWTKAGVARTARLATHLVNEHEGNVKEVISIPR